MMPSNKKHLLSSGGYKVFANNSLWGSSFSYHLHFYFVIPFFMLLLFGWKETMSQSIRRQRRQKQTKDRDINIHTNILLSLHLIDQASWRPHWSKAPVHREVFLPNTGPLQLQQHGEWHLQPAVSSHRWIYITVHFLHSVLYVLLCPY